MSSAASGAGPFPRRIFIPDQHIERQQISQARKILCELFPIEGDSFHKFSDGYGILFHVELSAAHQKVRTWEDAEQDDENVIPTGAGQFNPEDLEGVSIHST